MHQSPCIFHVKDDMRFDDISLSRDLSNSRTETESLRIELSIVIDNKFEQVWYPNKIMLEPMIERLYSSGEDSDVILVVDEKKFQMFTDLSYDTAAKSSTIC
jgi:hypothetical protein